MNLENNLKEKIEVVEVAKAEQSTEFKYIGSLKPKRNHHVFEINMSTLSVKRADLEPLSDFLLKGEKTVSSKNRKIVTNKECIYVSAMNAKNAIKKLNKKIKEGVYNLKQIS